MRSIFRKRWVVWPLITSGSILFSFIAASLVLSRPQVPTTELQNTVGVVKEGAYLARISACVACHTDTQNGGQLLAGGAAIETPFGNFYAPNITSDAEFGIGDWTLKEFYTALKAGVSPSGVHYYPAFPYTSYTNLSLDDIADIKAYLDSVTPIQQANRAHDLSWPASLRPLMVVWKALFQRRQNRTQYSNQRQERGEYLVRGPGHCAECHSQRNVFGAISPNKYLLGNTRGPNGYSVPALAGRTAEIQQWQPTDLVFYLQTGFRPDGDVASGSMTEVIEEVTAYLDQADAESMTKYLLNLP